MMENRMDSFVRGNKLINKFYKNLKYFFKCN